MARRNGAYSDETIHDRSIPRSRCYNPHRQVPLRLLFALELQIVQIGGRSLLASRSADGDPGVLEGARLREKVGEAKAREDLDGEVGFVAFRG